MSKPQFQPSTYKILIVDDMRDNLRLLSTTLTEQAYQVRCAKNGAIALMEARNDLPDLILLDINLPDLDGYQVCEQLKADPTTSSIPIIFLSAQDDIQDKVKAFTLGGVDFMGKPFPVEEVVVRVRNQLVLQAANAEIITLNEELEQRVQERTSQIELANYALKQEVLQRRQLELRLRYEALHDSLTGLPNRSLFMQQVERCLDNVIDHPEEQFAILFVDLDRFKIINDSLGHLAGDELLIACASRLQECITKHHTLARLGGDEFTILLEQIRNVDDAVVVAEKILEKFNTSFDLEDRRITITVSIGIVIADSEYRQETDLLRNADTAMYWAKEQGKARYEIFTQQMYLDVMRRLKLEHELRDAIANRELVLYYQPIFSLDHQELTGFEALVRWQHGSRGLVSPEEFIPLAEETGLIIPLGEWVMSEACLQLKNWQDKLDKLDKLPQAKSLTMSINVAGKQLYNSHFLTMLDRIIAETKINPQYLKLEITESMLIGNTEQVITVLQQIKTRQIQLSIDDFGTGYSSLSYLPQFSIDILKIDRSFVDKMNQEQQNLEIVKTIINLAQVLDLQIVAEGIETEEQYQTLKSLGVEFAQGYLFAKPLAATQAEIDLLSDSFKF